VLDLEPVRAGGSLLVTCFFSSTESKDRRFGTGDRELEPVTSDRSYRRSPVTSSPPVIVDS